MQSPSYVWVARQTEVLTWDGEVYVFNTEEAAEAFAEARADDYTVSEEIVLDMQFAVDCADYAT